ncbi:hypothetical protein OSI08_27545, partial [Mycobacterium ulcerans]
LVGCTQRETDLFSPACSLSLLFLQSHPCYFGKGGTLCSVFLSGFKFIVPLGVLGFHICESVAGVTRDLGAWVHSELSFGIITSLSALLASIACSTLLFFIQ